MNLQSDPAALAPALLAWFEHHGRHDLPWKRDPTPYRVWVSEIMLQQTQVATVLPFYLRFTDRFPGVESLAAAPVDEVLGFWTGLGYYARARNLHRAALLVVEAHNGCLPEDLEALQALPGIGRSTAGAILALSRGQRHPILDGNARRVLSRCFGVEGDPSRPDTQQRLWRLAEACTPAGRVSEYTQAIMDLGAGICVRSRPACDACPLAEMCVARVTNRQAELPSRRRRRDRPQRRAFAAVVIDAAGALFLERRPVRGVWGGLYSLPTFDSEEALSAFVGSLPGSPAPERLPDQHHAFTHYDLTLELRIVRLHSLRPCLEAPAPRLWYDPAQPAAVGLSKAVTLLLQQREA